MSRYLIKFSNSSCDEIYRCSKRFLSHVSQCKTNDSRFPLSKEILKKYFQKELDNKRSFVTLSKYMEASNCKFQNQQTVKKQNCALYYNQIFLKRDLSSRTEDDTESTDVCSTGSLQIIPTFEHLLSYLDVSVEIGDVNHAENVLLQFTQVLNSDYGTDAVSLFNVVLHGWANEGNWIKVLELLDKMELLCIEPNLQSFCAAIESVARSSSDKDSIEKILAKIDERPDLHLENLFDECIFVSDQREKVMEGIHLVNPDFNPKRREKNFKQNIRQDSDLLKVYKSTTPKQQHKKLLNQLSIEELHQLIELQLERECATQIPVSVILKPVTDDYLHWRKVWNNYIETWRGSLREAFQDGVSSLGGKTSQLNLYPYMTTLKPESYVNISLQVIQNVIQNTRMGSLKLLQMDIGNKIMKHYFIQKEKKNGVLDKIKAVHKTFIEYYCNNNISAKYTPREYWELVREDISTGPTPIHSDKFWPREVVQNIGVFMLEIIINNVLIHEDPFQLSTDRKMPAMNVIWNKKTPSIRCAAVMRKLFSAAYGGELMMIDSSILPMISPPLPWSSFHTGGFITHSVSVLRLPQELSDNYQKQVEDAVSDNLHDMFDALNTLSGCAWKINEPLLDLAIDIYTKGGNPDLGIPELHQMEQKGGFQIERIERKRTFFEPLSPLELLSARQKQSIEGSKRNDIKFALSIANAFRKNVIWQPHIADFKGNPISCLQHFKHSGTSLIDVIGSMFLFANGEEIGEKGIECLKVQLVDLTDISQNFSPKKKIEYCNEILDDVMDSADNPLTGRKWWLTSRRPWQMLACCMELTKCLRSPNPQKYICHLPIYKKNLFEEIQYYPALLRDEQGAEMVNLVPQEKSLGYFSELAEKIEFERKKDEDKDIKIARMLNGYINQDLVKLIIRSISYGASANAIFLKIFLHLNKTDKVFPSDYQEEASVYLSAKTVQIAQNLFSSTKQLQSWLNKIARMISCVYQEPIQWMSPFGFPVILPHSEKMYTENMEEEEILSFDVTAADNERLLDVEKRKKSFPINYIKSLLAAHKLLVALECAKQGMEFAFRRDSYLTLPSSVDTLNQISREQFVALLSQPLLENLANDMAELCVAPKNYDNTLPSELLQVLNSLPHAGNFDIKKVLNSS